MEVQSIVVTALITDIDIVLSPAKNGTKFRYFKINPTPEGVPVEMLEELAADAFKKIGAEHERSIQPASLCIKPKRLTTLYC